jgi:hypothetical protein
MGWIRSLPCCLCHVYELKQKSRTEAAHTGPRGLSNKADDRGAIPLCGILHHREGPESHHKLGKRFFEHHRIDREVLVGELNRQYELRKA